MHNVTPPPVAELPSSSALLRSTVIALVTALVLLVTAVMPAEYGVDPSGIGGMLGLTRMGEVKMALAREAAAASAAEAALAAGVAPGDPASTGNSHVTELALAPGKGREIKLVMAEGARATFSWSVAGGVVNYDTHGDPHDAPPGFYHGYGKGTGAAGDEGVLVAAFDGIHGWFWRNRGSSPVTVTLRTQGDYQELREMK